MDDSIPFTKISNSNLYTHFNNDHVLQSNSQVLKLSQNQINIPCNLCLECNPECTACLDNICEDPRRICNACLSCNYILDKNDLSSVFHEFSSTFQNLVSAIHFNARSLSKNLSAITSLIGDCNINFDLIGITETKLHVDNPQNVSSTYSETENTSTLSIPGFEFEHTPTNLAFGGAALYISHKFEYKRRPDFEFCFDGCETCFVELISQDKNRNVIVGIIYRHPHNNFDEFFSKLQSTCEQILRGYNLILMGDTNIDISVGTSVTQANTYQDLLLGLDVKNLISRPTRITNTTETIIDHILTNLSYDSVKSGIVVSDITDHLPVFGLFNLPVKQKFIKPSLYRYFKSSKKPELVEVFSNILDSLRLDTSIDFDPDDYLEKVLGAVNNSVDKVFPLQKRSKKEIKKFKNPWITQGILNSIHECHYLYYTAYIVKKDEASIKKYKVYK